MKYFKLIIVSMLLFPSSFALASDASDFFYNSENFEIFSVFVKTPIGINKINLDPNQTRLMRVSDKEVVELFKSSKMNVKRFE